MDNDILANLMKRFPVKVLPNGNIRVLGRVSFPNLVKPRAGQGGGEPKYGMALLFPKGYDLAPLVDSTKAKAIEIHGPKALELVAAEKIKWPIKDQGKEVDDDGKIIAGYTDGAKFVRLTRTTKPRIVDQSMTDIEASRIYAGCWTLTTVNPYGGTYEDKEVGKIRYVSVGLNNIQFLADDEKFGRADSDPNDEFGVIDGSTDGATAFSKAATTKPNGASEGYDFG